MPWGPRWSARSPRRRSGGSARPTESARSVWTAWTSWRSARRSRGRSLGRGSTRRPRSWRRTPTGTGATPCAIRPARCTGPRRRSSARSCGIRSCCSATSFSPRASSWRPTCGRSKRTSTTASTRPWRSPTPRRSHRANGSSPTSTRRREMAVMTYREALNLALREEMRRDPRVFVIGEEVGLYDGAYKVTQGLLKEFGGQPVVDSPIPESGFPGVGIGPAMAGLRPLVEMMTFNFALLPPDQIVNSAAKMYYMSGGQFNVPIVIRGPGGPAAQLAAQHSQSMETYFYHVPGLKVVRPTTPMDAKGLLESSIRDDKPVIFIEAETLYAVKGEVPDDPEFIIPLGQAVVRRGGTDVTVIAYMGMMYRALEAAEELAKEGISVEIVDPRTLRPMDTETIIGSVRKTHRAVVVEAGAGGGAH